MEPQKDENQIIPLPSINPPSLTQIPLLAPLPQPTPLVLSPLIHQKGPNSDHEATIVLSSSQTTQSGIADPQATLVLSPEQAMPNNPADPQATVVLSPTDTIIIPDSNPQITAIESVENIESPSVEKTPSVPRYMDSASFLGEATSHGKSVLPKSLTECNLNPTLAQAQIPHYMIAKKLGPYNLLAEIGAGGMGKVYKAYHPQLDRIVAIKVMLRTGQLALRERSRFLAEAQLAAKLQHPNIVAVHDVGSDQGVDYIVMDYVDGESLSELMRHNPPSPRRALEMIQEVADAMEYAHRQKIIHRDLKPGNLLIDKHSRRVVITDFGLAKNLEEESHLTRSGEAIGTPKYMAPEQAMGNHQKIGPCTDVYSLGAILYELLTGHPASPGETTATTIYAVLYQEVIPPRKHRPELARDLDTICLKALAKDISQRYGSAGDFAEDIRRFLNGEMILGHCPTIWYYLGKYIRNHRTFVLMMMVLVVAALVALFEYKYYQSQYVRQYLNDLQRQISQVSHYQTIIQEYPNLDQNTEIPAELENKIKSAIQDYQRLITELETIVELDPKNQRARQHLYEIHREIGLLALASQNFVLSELYLERCKNFGSSDEAEQLLNQVSKKRQENKLQRQKQAAQYLNLAHKQLALPLAQESQALIADFMHSSQPPAIPKNLDLKAMVVLYVTASNHVGKAFDLSPESKTKQELSEMQRNIGVLAALGNDYILSQISLERAASLGDDVSVKLLQKVELKMQEEQQAQQHKIQEYLSLAQGVLQQEGAMSSEKIASRANKESWNSQKLYEARKEALMLYVEASGYFEHILSIAPDHAQAKQNLYQIYRQIGMLGLDSDNDLLSWMAFKGCASLSPGQESDELLKKIEERRKQNRPKPVSPNAQQPSTTSPQSGFPSPQQPTAAETALQKGNASLSQGNLTAALQAYNQAIELDPQLAQAYFKRGMVYNKRKDYRQAEKDFTSAIGIKPKDAYSYFHRGIARYSIQDHTGALADYDKALQLGLVSEPLLYHNRGVIRFQTGNQEGAIQDYTQALKLNSRMPGTYFTRAMARQHQGDIPGALQDLSQAIQLQPSFAKAYHQRGQIYHQHQQNFAAALQDYQKAIAHDPQFARAYMDRGAIYFLQKDFTAALKDYNAALALNSRDAETYYLRAIVYVEQGNAQQAIRDLTSTLQYNPGYADAYKHRALLFANQGQHTKAVADLQQYLQLVNDDPDTPQLRAYIQKHSKN